MADPYRLMCINISILLKKTKKARLPLVPRRSTKHLYIDKNLFAITCCIFGALFTQSTKEKNRRKKNQMISIIILIF